ncbi:hypothetical protein [Verrucosispora sp. WMMD1129]|uniref:hypothetical protein n=1 Tax=Verrucosispora sp. WMMD1129 TaxID=3016093 RepID=UPI00249A8E0E|nr:hypothetical protein [Verrucosispora sp. WMMD1129]WFE46884.1 hypothetical protein O7624_22375 [Verrucosispora sp. WMMD1129]
MRRPLAVAVATAALLVGTACSAERPDAGEPSAPASTGVDVTTGPVTPTPEQPVATPASGAAGGNAPEICAAAQQASGDAGKKYVEQLAAMATATGAGDTADAQAAGRRAEAALADWEKALRAQAARADDQRLKELLTELSTEVGQLGTDIEALEGTALDRLQQRLDKLCAR